MIYADHAATTQLSQRAKEAMLPWLGEEYGNPSTLYSLARNPRKAVARAREQIATAIGAKPDEVFFTSCGTESDNWALLGSALRYPHSRKRIVTSCIEHHAVLHTCAFLEKLGYEVIYLPVDQYGVISPEQLDRVITPDTVLVSIMMGNNEIGTIEPIQALAAVSHQHGVPFHTDAVQAVGHIPLDVDTLDVDMLSASAHKFNGPKGTGFLYVRKGTPLEPLLNGGGQESGMRSGTENVAGIVGMAVALTERIEALQTNMQYLESLRHRLIQGLRANNMDFVVNGSGQHIPGSLSLSFSGCEGEMLLHRLDLMGIAIATGSACNSKDTILSHVIQAIGVPEAYANGTIRITLGMDNTEEQVDQITAAICKVLR